MPFKRGGRLLPEKIEGMNQDDAAKIKLASGLPVICVGGWQTASRIRDALQRGPLRRHLHRARPAGQSRTWCSGSPKARTRRTRPCTYCNKCLVNALLQPLACWEEARFDSREQMFDEAYRVYKEASVGARATRTTA